MWINAAGWLAHPPRQPQPMPLAAEACCEGREPLPFRGGDASPGHETWEPGRDDPQLYLRFDNRKEILREDGLKACPVSVSGFGG